MLAKLLKPFKKSNTIPRANTNDKTTIKKDSLKNDLLKDVNTLTRLINQCFFDEKTLEKKKAIEKVLKSIAHKVYHKETTAHKKFEDNLKKQILALEKQGFDFSNELSKLA